ncbi:MAG TPA: hypothetical protein VFU37_24215 [Pyrinomonadaceae bacterium]|nr:hypothetical protein [Pyrinomonadaceae bacterium]
MTQTLEFKQIRDLDKALIHLDVQAMNADKLTGRWTNTDPNTRGLSEITIERIGERFSVSARGVGANGPIDWLAKSVTALANLEEEAGQRSIALAADFDFGFMKAETYLRVNKGVLVIVLFNTFKDQSGRTDYVTREFFYRRD